MASPNPAQAASFPETPPSRWRDRLARHQAWLVPLLLVTITAMAYAPAAWGAFVLDDRSHLYESARLRSLWPWDQFLSRRGLMDLTFAINYMIDGLNPRGYHILNVIIHMLAGLALYGLMRQLLRLPRWPDALRTKATPMAAIIAGLWLVHPLQTQAVTYVIQRGESLMGMFVLTAAWAVVRAAGTQGGRAILWGSAAILAMVMAVWTKESAVTMPLALLLIDALLVTGRMKWTMRKRWWLHLGLLATMALPLLGSLGELQVNPVTAPDTAAMLQHETGSPPPVRVVMPEHVIPSTMTLGHYPSAGFGMPGMTWKQYFFTQPAVIAYYLKLSLWPDWLSIEHNWRPMRTPWAGWRAIDLQLALALLVSLAVLSLWLLWRKPWLGVAGCWFFLALGVTSSVIPINDVAVEHRMYLAMAAVVVVAVIGVWLLWGRFVPPEPSSRAAAGHRLLTLVACAIILAAGVRTFMRNLDYRSELAIWQSAAAGQTPNTRILLNLGSSLYMENRAKDAAAMYQRVLAINPSDFNALLNTGNIAFNKDHDLDTAERYYRLALRMSPDSTTAMGYLARVHTRRGEYPQAVALLAKAVSHDPDNIALLNALGRNCYLMHDYAQALQAYGRVNTLSPSAAGWTNTGMVRVASGDLAGATADFRQAVALEPDFAPAWEQLARNLARQHQHRQARDALERAIALEPTMARSRQMALLLASSPDESVRDLPRAMALVQQGLAITRQQDPAWLEVAARVAMAADDPKLSLQMEKRAYAIALQRGAPPHVLEQARAQIQRLQQRIDDMHRSHTHRLP